MTFFTSESINLGSLALNTNLLYLLIGLFFGFLALHIFTEENKLLKKEVGDIFVSSLLIVLVVWKLFPLFLAPGDVFSNPLILLYSSGGPVGIIAGIFFGGSYIVFRILKGKKSGKKNLIKPLLILIIASATITSILFIISVSVRSAGSNQVINIEKAAVSFNAPDFELMGVNGKSYRLSDHRGKWVILNFWATWCPPCLAELPLLSSYYTEANKNNVILLGLNASSTEKIKDRKDLQSYLTAFIEQKEISFPVLIDSSGAVSNKYLIENLPTTVIISPEGIITKIKTGAVNSFWLSSVVDD